MILSEVLIVEAARKAGIKVPPDELLDKEWDNKQYPHFAAYCNMQLNKPVQWGEHWENAKVIASIPLDDLLTMTVDDIIDRGFQY